MNQNKKKVLCYCAVFLQIKKEAEKTAKTTTNVVLKEGDCGEVVDKFFFKDRLFVVIFVFF